ncbi:MAG TPA: transcription antitermination factor NusB, partial [Salinimicrobium catena]|nr:transcription antitermination factor NusB [Salinimicrobium catena]
MDEMYDLYLLLLSLFVEIRDHAADYMEKSQHKHLPSEEDKDPNRRFVDNEVIALLDQNTGLQNGLEARKLKNWKNDDEYVDILWNEIRNSEIYAQYMASRTGTFQEDKDFVIKIFKEVIAPNEKLYDYLEDKKITWVDDLPLVNTAIVKMLQKLKSGKEHALTRLFKNSDDKEYAVQLFRKTLLNDESLAAEMEGKTPNWDKERIADLDTILIKMAICEFLKFPSIPVKVTINEYLEIAKEYSTPKSSIFINGILDKLSKEYKEEGKLNKIGRGLM